MTQPSHLVEDILSLLAAAGQNVHVSLLNARPIFDFFHRFDQYLRRMGEHLSKTRYDGNDPAYINLTLFALASRQMRNAFLGFLRSQSYDGQLIFRPGVEAAIYAYRIFELPELGKVFVNREDDFKAFSKEFRFSALPERMPHREDLEKYLDALNDYRSHPNIFYFAGWVENVDGLLRVNYFDEERLWWQALFAFLSIAWKVTHVFRSIFAADAKIFIAETDAEFEGFKTELEKLRKQQSAKLSILLPGF